MPVTRSFLSLPPFLVFQFLQMFGATQRPSHVVSPATLLYPF